MALPPLPDVPCVRVRVIYGAEGDIKFGSRFYLSYAGSAPSGANCTTLAGDIGSAWATHVLPLIPSYYGIDEVDVLDIATRSGYSGQGTAFGGGTRAGTALPNQVATNVEFGIARRYRGGKPRMYFPPGVESDLLDQATWQSSYTGDVNAGIAALFAAIEALTVGGMGALQHVNLNYYHGFTNKTSSSGRAYAQPDYTAVAAHDNVTGYFCKAELSSQRRRRTSLI